MYIIVTQKIALQLNSQRLRNGLLHDVVIGVNTGYQLDAGSLVSSVTASGMPTSGNMPFF